MVDYSASNRTFSAVGVKSVTPSDTADIEPTPAAIYIGGDGNLAVTMADGSTATFAGLTAGTVLPIQPKRVASTSTTATLILALYN